MCCASLWLQLQAVLKRNLLLDTASGCPELGKRLSPVAPLTSFLNPLPHIGPFQSPCFADGGRVLLVGEHQLRTVNNLLAD